MKEFFKSKLFLGGIGVLVVLMAMTNPGKLELNDEIQWRRVSYGDTYTNFVVLSFGTSYGYEGKLRFKEGKAEYISQSTIASYIGIFNNYFCFVEFNNSGNRTFEIIPK